MLWTSSSSSVSQGTYLILDLPYTCHLSEETAVLVVASSVYYSMPPWNYYVIPILCPHDAYSGPETLTKKGPHADDLLEEVFGDATDISKSI